MSLYRNTNSKSMPFEPDPIDEMCLLSLFYQIETFPKLLWRSKASEINTGEPLLLIGEQTSDPNKTIATCYHIQSFEKNDTEELIHPNYVISVIIKNSNAVILIKDQVQFKEYLFKSLEEVHTFLRSKNLQMNGTNKLPNTFEKLFLETGELSLEEELNEWSDNFAKLKQLMNTSDLKKMVLSRFQSFSHKLRNLGEIVNWSVIRNSLLESEQYFILYQKSIEEVFFSQSPERLFSINNNTLTIDALAGTRERLNNKDKNKIIMNELLTHPKELKEHALVEEFIINTLNSLQLNWVCSKEISIKKFKYVQHLYREFTATLEGPLSWSSLLETLHPTPAIGSLPKKFNSSIKMIEKRKRGLYAGTLTLISNSNIDSAVLLRSFSLNNQSVTFHAGCGITQESQVNQEFIETQKKLLNYTNSIQVTEAPYHHKDLQIQAQSEIL